MENVMTRREFAIRRATFACIAALATTVAWTSAAQAGDEVKVRFSWKLKGEYGPFYLAQEKGFYAANGLSVRMGEPGTLGNELHPSADDNGVISKVIIDATLAPELRSSYSKVVYPKVDLAALLAGQPVQTSAAKKTT
jgi:hypothetical protein